MSLPPRPFADALRERTRALHQRAERSGFVQQMLQGRATRYGYALYLRNLLPAYQTLEQGLEQHRGSPGVRVVARTELYRSAAIAADLESLCGRQWSARLALQTSGARYARWITRAGARRGGAALVAHAYTRFLGDLNGGRVLKTLLARTPGLAEAALSFYEFPAIADLAGFRADYRKAFDQAAREVADDALLLHEAGIAFRLNISISCAVARAITTAPTD